MNTTVEEGAFTGALQLDEEHKDEVISLADNCGPFEPLFESEEETENLEAKHGTGDRLGGELAPHSEDGFGFIVGASPVDCTPPYMGVFDSVLLSDEKHEGKIASLDSVFGSFESDMLLEVRGEMGNDNEQKTRHPVPDKLALRTADGKGVGVATTRRRCRSAEPILLSESEGEMDNKDQYRIGQLVRDELTLRTEDWKGIGIATEPYYAGVVKSGKGVQIGNSHPTSKPKQEHHQPYALAWCSKVTPSNYKMSYSELLRLGPPECKSRYRRKAQRISGAFGSASSPSTPTTSSDGQGSNRPPTGSQVLKPYNR